MADLSRKERIPTRNTINMRGETRGNTRETLNQQEIDHTCARSINTKEDTLIQSQQRTIQTVTGFFSVRRS